MAVLLTQCTGFTAEPEPIFMATYKNTENKHTGGFAKVGGEQTLWCVQLYFKGYLHE